MKSDFALAKEELSQIGIKRVAADFYQEPRRKGSCYFVKSPATHDKTASLAIYPNSNRFCDFANGNLSGDHHTLQILQRTQEEQQKKSHLN